MTLIDTAVRTISCDGPECTKSVTFDQKDAVKTAELPENVWLKSTRVVNTADNRHLVYCSDECEIKGIATGKHNIPTIIQPTGANANAVAIAAQAAERARQADQVLRSGQGGNLTITDR